VQQEARPRHRRRGRLDEGGEKRVGRRADRRREPTDRGAIGDTDPPRRPRGGAGDDGQRDAPVQPPSLEAERQHEATQEQEDQRVGVVCCGLRHADDAERREQQQRQEAGDGDG
jgi:hypothetical protein